MLNMLCRNGNGRNGQGTPVEMSQMMEMLEDGIGISSSFKEDSDVWDFASIGSLF